MTEGMIRSWIISQQQMGTEEICVCIIQTQLVLKTFENGPFQEYLKEELGVDVSDQDFALQI